MSEGDVIAELTAIEAEMDEFAQRHNPECECEVIHATREVVRRIRTVLHAPHTPAEPVSPVSTPTETPGEMQGSREVRE